MNNKKASDSRLDKLKKIFRRSEKNSGKMAKAIAIELEMDYGQWSRTKTLQSHFPLLKMRDFIRVCKSDALLRWIAEDCGYDLVKQKNGFEERLQDKAKELKENIDLLYEQINTLCQGK